MKTQVKEIITKGKNIIKNMTFNDIVSNMCIVICSLILIWIFGSFVDVIMHNDPGSDYVYSKYNFFSVLIECASDDEVESNTEENVNTIIKEYNNDIETKDNMNSTPKLEYMTTKSVEKSNDKVEQNNTVVTVYATPMKASIHKTMNTIEDNIESVTQVAEVSNIGEVQAETIENTAEYENMLYLLSHLIFAEAGSDWCTDTMQLYVGSVALNRVKDDLYPSTLEGVIFDTNCGVQYACTVNGGFYNEPNERAIESAKYLIENGSVLPENVIFQSQFVQGSGVYTQEQNIYFCYK